MCIDFHVQLIENLGREGCLRSCKIVSECGTEKRLFMSLQFSTSCTSCLRSRGADKLNSPSNSHSTLCGPSHGVTLKQGPEVCSHLCPVMLSMLVGVFCRNLMEGNHIKEQ